MRSFVQSLTYRSARRVILKSPTHTGRVGILSRLFPGAQFIHITRNPLDLFPSTCRLWKSLDAVQGCQLPHHEQLDEYVFDALLRMYDGFEKQRAELDPAQIVDIRYEDLVADPMGVVEGVYQKLNLGDFTPVRGVAGNVCAQPAIVPDELPSTCAGSQCRDPPPLAALR